MEECLLRARGLKKSFGRKGMEVEVLRGIDLTVSRGEYLAVTGASGSGKSTLLHILGALERPSSGSVHFQGRSIEGLHDAELSGLRRRSVGFVFQFFNLHPTMTVAENVALPWLLDRRPYAAVKAKVGELLIAVGLTGRGQHLPNQLSGGEMQRVAIARALSMDAPLILADEPTGNLDSWNGAMVLDLLERQVREKGKTLILVTHDPAASERADRMVRLRDGLIDSA